MKKQTSIIMACLVAGMSLAGCAQKPVVENASQAIEQSKAKGPVESQANFLLEQAKALAASKNYAEAMNVANYVVANFKDKAPEAQKLLQDIQVKLQQALKEKMGAVEKDVNAAADDISKKLSTFGK